MSYNEYCYYILTDVMTTAKGDLKIGERIIAIPTTEQIFFFEEGEGPFYNIEILKEKSKIYINLKNNNPRRAHKILQSKYISKISHAQLYYEDITFDSKLMDIWQHIVRGDEKVNDISGVHFYDKRFVKIKEILNKNLKGVILAIIEAKKKESENWIERKEPTTLFPLTWSIQQLSDELEFAFKNKIRENEMSNRYRGTSYNGVEIIFVIVKNKVKTAYPIL